MLPFQRNARGLVSIVIIASIWMPHQPREHAKKRQNKKQRKKKKDKTQIERKLRIKTSKNRANGTRDGNNKGSEDSSLSGIGGEATLTKTLRSKLVLAQHSPHNNTMRSTIFIAAHYSHPTAVKSIILTCTGEEGWRCVHAAGIDTRKAQSG